MQRLSFHDAHTAELKEWFDVVNGYDGNPAVGSRLVTVAHRPGYGMRWVYRHLFTDLAAAYDTDGFWAPSLHPADGLRPRIADPD